MDDAPTATAELRNILRISVPVALVNLSTHLMHITDLAVLGHALGTEALAAACLCLVVVNLTQEPGCFILANAMTTLCTDAYHARGAAHDSSAHLPYAYLAAALLFSLLLALPIGLLLVATPPLLSLLAVPSAVLEAARRYAPLYVVALVPALLQSLLLGYLRAQKKIHSTVP